MDRKGGDVAGSAGIAPVVSEEVRSADVFADDFGRPDPPADPARVTADTSLAALNLNWRERDLPERERTKHVHRLHPYLGKYVPQLAEVFLRKYWVVGQTVLDPFCGSGTTLVQANELGINAVGYDVSAFNVLLSRAKTAVYDPLRLRREVEDVLARTSALSATLSATEVTSTLAPGDPYLETWYAPLARRQLLTYRALVAAGSYAYPDLLWIILSRAARSVRLTTHFELDFPRAPQLEPYWCYKHRRECRPATDALKFLRRYSVDTLRRVAAFATMRSTARVTVHYADSRRADFPAADGVITSPPYVGLIDYHEQHAYAYHLLGLESLPAREIGAPDAGNGRLARRRYQEDVAAVLRRAATAMPCGGTLVVVAADRHDLYPEIAVLAGLQPVDVVRRQVDRRTGRRARAFYESVFIWRKP